MPSWLVARIRHGSINSREIAAFDEMDGVANDYMKEIEADILRIVDSGLNRKPGKKLDATTDVRDDDETGIDLKKIYIYTYIYVQKGR